MLFLTQSRCRWVSPKSSHPLPQCACSLHPLLSIHTSRDLKAWIKMLSVSGRSSLVTGWNRVIWENSRGRVVQIQQKERPRFSVSARVQHGTKEIYFGHRARAQELRLRVRNCMDNGQRWASRIQNICLLTPRSSTGPVRVSVLWLNVSLRV